MTGWHQAGCRTLRGEETRCHGREESDSEKPPTAAAGVCRRRRPQLSLRCLSARLPLANRARQPFAHAQDISYLPRHPLNRGTTMTTMTSDNIISHCTEKSYNSSDPNHWHKTPAEIEFIDECSKYVKNCKHLK